MNSTWLMALGLLINGILASTDCDEGYKQNQQGGCDDINECEIVSDSCLNNQYCVNLNGSFRCVWVEKDMNGFFKNSKGNYIDIDECAGTTHGCDAWDNLVCVNTPGSYECKCAKGFKDRSHWNPMRLGGKCVDVDECAENTDNCEQICTNTHGSYKCSCAKGYTLGNDGISCMDINECEANDGRGTCDHYCHNKEGYLECSCKDGYFFNMNKCIRRTHCPQACYGKCESLRDVHKCSCHQGYVLKRDGKSCYSERDKCPNGDICKCPEGYFLSSNRTVCIEDQCRENGGKGPCDHRCKHVYDSYLCGCNSDYILHSDGRKCERTSPKGM